MTQENLDLLWMQPNWQEASYAWIHAQLKRLGLQADGAIEQPHVRPWSTVMRVPTTAGVLYFKASAPAFAQETALTDALCRWNPHGTPRVLAADVERSWMLMADGGATLRSVLQTDSDITHWHRVLPLYAGIQQQASVHAAEMPALGVPDRRLEILPELYERLLADTAVLRVDQPEGLTAEEYQRLQERKPQFAAQCVQLAKAGIPETLQHDDLHDGNILVHEGNYLVFDWGDSCLSHPFFSLQVILRSAGRTLNLELNAPALLPLRDLYLDLWIPYAPYEELARACALAQPLAMVCRSLTWYRLVSSMEEPRKAEYAEYVSGWLQEYLLACAGLP